MPSAYEPPSTRLQVDELILDYLLWYCTSSLLHEARLPRASAERGEAARTADMGIRLVRSFNSTFARMHPHAALPEPIKLRLRTCRFACALLRRVDPTTDDLTSSTSSALRSQSWLSRRQPPVPLPPPALFGPPHTPFSPDALARNQELALQSLPHAALRGELTLRDAFWEFLLLSAHLFARYEEASDGWIRVSAGFMVQSCLEAYGVLGAEGAAAATECFSFGPAGMWTSETSIEEIAVDEIFGGDAGAVGRRFEEAKQKALQEMISGASGRLEDRFEELRQREPEQQFVEDVANEYLFPATKALPKPVLGQLEAGQLEGFGDEEVSGVLRNAGVAAEVWNL